MKITKQAFFSCYSVSGSVGSVKDILQVTLSGIVSENFQLTIPSSIAGIEIFHIVLMVGLRLLPASGADHKFKCKNIMLFQDTLVCLACDEIKHSFLKSKQVRKRSWVVLGS